MPAHNTDYSDQGPYPLTTASPQQETAQGWSEAHAPWASNQALKWPASMARIGLAVILPLFAGLITIAAVDKRYEGQAAWKVQGSNPASLPVYRQALLDAAWQTHASLVPDRAASWEVTQEADSATLALSVTAAGRPAVATLLGQAEAAFRAEVGSRAATQQAEREERRTAFTRTRGRVQAAIGELDDQLASESGAGEANSPLEALQTRVEDITARWTAYRKERTRLQEAVARRDALQQSPPTRSATIASDVRNRAYRGHTALQEDERHLDLQLAQIRSAILAVRNAASPALDDVLRSAEAFADLYEDPSVGGLAPAQRRRVEELIETADELHRRTMAFAQSWTRVYLALDEMDPANLPEDLVATYDRTADNLRDYFHVSGQLIGSLHHQVRALTESEEGPQPIVRIAAAIGERFRTVQAAAQRFEAVGSDLIAADNYMLDAALQSARGLLQRTRAMRETIDAALEETVRRRAATERAAQIDAITLEIERMRRDLLGDMDALMTAHEGTERLTGELPMFLHQASVREAAQTRRAALAARLEELDAEQAAWETQTEVPMSEEAIELQRRTLGSWPVNLPVVAALGALAASLTLLALLAGFRLRAGWTSG